MYLDTTQHCLKVTEIILFYLFWNLIKIYHFIKCMSIFIKILIHDYIIIVI